MVQGLRRNQEAGDLHFVTISCYDRRPYLGSADVRDCFLVAMERMRVRYGFCVLGYVVMPEHVHLLVAEPVSWSLSTALQAVKLSVTKYRPERPFWTKRYHDFNVFTAEKCVEKLRYLHLNTVARGLVAEPEKWKWSSFRDWWSGEVWGEGGGVSCHGPSTVVGVLRVFVRGGTHVSNARYGVTRIDS